MSADVKRMWHGCSAEWLCVPQVRAKTFWADKTNTDVTQVDVPVVGGHAGVTILPLFSQVPHPPTHSPTHPPTHPLNCLEIEYDSCKCPC